MMRRPSLFSWLKNYQDKISKAIGLFVFGSLIVIPFQAFGRDLDAATLLSQVQPNSASAEGKEVLDLDLSKATLTNKGFEAGFLLGTDVHSKARMSSLNTGYWGVGSFEQAQFAARNGAKTTLLMMEIYAAYKGGLRNAKPWNDWPEFERVVQKIVEQARARSIPVDYWEIWNEPNSREFWQGTPEQFLEMTSRAIKAVRAVDPNAKIVGFSSSEFAIKAIEYYLDYIKSQGLKIDALAWHEFIDEPKLIKAHVATARALFERKGLKLEIHVNEFVSGPHHLIPGWNLAYLISILESNVNFASRACWHRADGRNPTSECGPGLNGLLIRDESSLTPLGALYASWALAKLDRHVVNQSLRGISSIATARIGDKGGRVLIGRYSCGRNNRWCGSREHQAADQPQPAKTVLVRLTSPAWSNKRVQFKSASIANKGLELTYSSAPVNSQTYTANAKGLIEFHVNLEDGSVFVLAWETLLDTK